MISVRLKQESHTAFTDLLNQGDMKPFFCYSKKMSLAISNACVPPYMTAPRFPMAYGIHTKTEKLCQNCKAYHRTTICVFFLVISVYVVHAGGMLMLFTCSWSTGLRCHTQMDTTIGRCDFVHEVNGLAVCMTHVSPASSYVLHIFHSLSYRNLLIKKCVCTKRCVHE